MKALIKLAFLLGAVAILYFGNNLIKKIYLNNDIIDVVGLPMFILLVIIPLYIIFGYIIQSINQHFNSFKWGIVLIILYLIISIGLGYKDHLSLKAVIEQGYLSDDFLKTSVKDKIVNRASVSLGLITGLYFPFKYRKLKSLFA
ncbi:hypothetical protein OO013_07315 [Mangrovivirga sp. M17]|uniref:Uncharacterized protein n=1 Tax=Mangrovivirga halotolerans TaxID=2993936 RepID=A0ABT3RQ04_9BACT|nr:hypothetical protein [Mangrovivirga halotolerans]MCX2743667.1 hypothetical protein [Mangrovivirga halotolerans]